MCFKGIVMMNISLMFVNFKSLSLSLCIYMYLEPVEA